MIDLCNIDTISLDYVAETLIYALNSFSDMRDTINDFEISADKKVNEINDILDDFFEWAELKKQEFQAKREELKKLSILS